MEQQEIRKSKKAEFFIRLKSALASDDEKDVRALMEDPLINQTADVNWTPLMLAVHSGSLNCVRALAERGDVNCKDANGSTALIWATAAGARDIVELLAPISDLSLRDLMGNTALMWAAINRQPLCARFICAASTQEELMIANNEGFTPLQKATKCGSEEVASEILMRESELERDCIAETTRPGSVSKSGLSL